MRISVNNKTLELTTAQNIKAILERMQFSNTKGIAVAVNNQVIPKAAWENHFLKENDNLIIIRATQGG